MKKIFLVFAIVFANSVFTSCTDLDENLENEFIKLETSVTGGEDGEDFDEEEEPTNGG
ncbi:MULTISPECIES: hypothetical protein [unclassified Polaribacter]|uniref:hypothetical protein n=1 Tax=unclassified Polaribacter TaxID=196858 RepID=UPI0016748F99|nr:MULTISPECIES: hypothetical protein [unclassified Polaribacter]